MRSKRSLNAGTALEVLESRRLLSGGALDTAFGDGGLYKEPRPSNDSVALLSVQADGKILTFGRALNSYTSGIHRLLPDGQEDLSFTPPILPRRGGEHVFFDDVVTLADGRLVTLINVSSNNFDKTDVQLLRFNRDGSIDPSFNFSFKDAYKSLFPADASIYMTDIALTPNDTITYAGQYWTAGGDAGLIVGRVNVDGTPDPTFGATRPGLADFGAPTKAAIHSIDLIVEVDGVILLPKKTTYSEQQPLQIIRLTSDGRVDTTFSPTGVRDVLDPTGQLAPYGQLKDATISPDGTMIVAVGYASNQSTG